MPPFPLWFASAFRRLTRDTLSPGTPHTQARRTVRLRDNVHKDIGNFSSIRSRDFGSYRNCSRLRYLNGRTSTMPARHGAAEQRHEIAASQVIELHLRTASQRRITAYRIGSDQSVGRSVCVRYTPVTGSTSRSQGFPGCANFRPEQAQQQAAAKIGRAHV